MSNQKRALAVHDISCFGRCSLTVALPIISSAGIETTVIPTAVLSTHTGGFTGFTYRDLTDDIEPILAHWKSLDLRFDAVYTGFLGSFEQISIVSSMFDDLRAEGTKVFVDPVMADNGELYKIFPPTFPAGMRSLCEKADLIMPNVTEATLMLGEEYVEGPYTEEYIEGLLKRLSDIGAGTVVLTGVYFEGDKLGAASYEKDADRICYAFSERIPGYYHGTGDVFGSALVGAVMRGLPVGRAIEIAVDYTAGSIRRTFDSKTDVRFGVNFEAGIEKYIKALNEDRT
jgi:pyridoxine kinase